MGLLPLVAGFVLPVACEVRSARADLIHRQGFGHIHTLSGTYRADEIRIWVRVDGYTVSGRDRIPEAAVSIYNAD
ncbi:hypothetical protein JCM13591A_00210 [Microbacterium xylanilyticum]